MESNQFNELIDNFYKSNEQLEKALEVMAEYSQKQKKADEMSNKLIETLAKSNAFEIIDISEAMKQYIEIFQKQTRVVEDALESLATEVGCIKNKIVDIESSIRFLMGNAEMLEKMEGILEAMNETADYKMEE